MTPRRETGARRRRRRDRPVVLLRQVPGDTPVHRLWAGTKLVAVAAVGLSLSFFPTWPGIAAGGVLLAVAAWQARIPASALPRPPVWLWATMAAGAALTLVSGGAPEVSVGGFHIGLGHLVAYARFVCLSVVLLGSSAMVGWTTPLGEIAPSVARLGSPLRRFRLPVDEWAVTAALAVRSFPLLAEELRVLVAARRLRPRPEGRRSVSAVLAELVDLLTASLAAAIRRAGEMGEAITARGGAGQLTAEPGRPQGWDVVALVAVACTCAAVVAVAQA